MVARISVSPVKQVIQTALLIAGKPREDEMPRIVDAADLCKEGALLVVEGDRGDPFTEAIEGLGVRVVG